MIVGICSMDEESIGFDTSIKWTINPSTGMKTSGTLETKAMITQEDGKKKKVEKTYQLVDLHPVAHQLNIRGRATTCWRVLDPVTKQEYLVKDSWSSEGRIPEYELLEKAKGLPGICVYESYEADRFQISQFRCETTIASGMVFNRRASRIVLQMYGKQVDDFQSILELLEVLRDAIGGKSDESCFRALMPTHHPSRSQLAVQGWHLASRYLSHEHPVWKGGRTRWKQGNTHRPRCGPVDPSARNQDHGHY